MSKAIKIKILDSKLSNVSSVKNMINWVGHEATIVRNLNEVIDGDRIILPGIGNFGKAMNYLKHHGLEDQIHEIANRKKNLILGICLGMQLLMNESEESPGIRGLGLIDGSVKKFNFKNEQLKIPHVGWNTLDLLNENPIFNNFNKTQSRYYFVHSYFVNCKNSENVLSKTNYGLTFDSAIFKENIYGFQFHPEKSLKHGANLVKNFCEMKF
tara:strand:+ start:5901 stop:6536 length:636 start_codon:yes stop_codon:yes gene_type:complete